MGTRTKIGLSIFLIGLAGCSDAAPPPSLAPDEQDAADAAELDSGRGSGDADVAPRDTGKDTGEPDAASLLHAFGEPCSGDETCSSGHCLETGDGYVCTRSCNSDCPAGWICITPSEPDPASRCVPDPAELCKVCEQDSDCGGAGNFCIDGFCGRTCAQAPCPKQYSCSEEQGFQCVPDDACQVSSEQCDGKDNDRDGKTDEPEDLDGPPAQKNTGVCSGMRQVCQDGRWQEPEYRTMPGYEAVEVSCDSADNDCDGETDEHLGQLTCSEGECTRTVAACLDGVQQNCVPGEPQPELCDNLDNDCDGSTDEGDDGAPLPRTCYTGPAGTLDVGICHEGSRACSRGHFLPECVGEVGPGREVCNGLDDDCDGTTDEDLAAPEADRHEGVCAGQKKICQGAQGWQEPDYEAITGFEAVESLCDLLDNDCDGESDEELLTDLVRRILGEDGEASADRAGPRPGQCTRAFPR